MIKIIIGVIILFVVLGWVIELVEALAKPISWIVVAAVSLFLLKKLGDLILHKTGLVAKAVFVIVIIVIAIFAIYLLYWIIMAIRESQFAQWTVEHGIGESTEVPGNETIWTRAENKEKVFSYEKNQKKYFISCLFYRWVLSDLEKEKIISGESFSALCGNLVPAKRIPHSDVLKSYAAEKHDIVVVDVYKIGENCDYILTKKFIQKFYEILKVMGAANREEFAVACAPTLKDTKFEGETNTVASALLEEFARRGDVEKITLQNAGALYIVKGVVQGTNFVKREVKLDD